MRVTIYGTNQYGVGAGVAGCALDPRHGNCRRIFSGGHRDPVQ